MQFSFAQALLLLLGTANALTLGNSPSGHDLFARKTNDGACPAKWPKGWELYKGQVPTRRSPIIGDKRPDDSKSTSGDDSEKETVKMHIMYTKVNIPGPAYFKANPELLGKTCPGIFVTHGDESFGLRLTPEQEEKEVEKFMTFIRQYGERSEWIAKDREKISAYIDAANMANMRRIEKSVTRSAQTLQINGMEVHLVNKEVQLGEKVAVGKGKDTGKDKETSA